MNYPKGYLVAIGGAEDKGPGVDEEDQKEVNKNDLSFYHLGILKSIVELVKQIDAPVIEIVTTASSLPEDLYSIYKHSFKKLGCHTINHLDITSREEADSKKTIQRVEKCNCLLFTGGDQLRLCSILGGTAMLNLLKNRYQNDKIVIAGTSAGAAAMSNTMISGGNSERAYMKGEVKLSIGFGLLNNVIIDTHFDKRGRFGRLAQAIAAQPGAIGLGLGEDTGVIIEKGKMFKAIGSSSVVVVEGSNVSFTNIADIKDGMPISVGNLIVNIMAHSDTYDLVSRQFKAVKFKPHEK